MDEDDRLSAGVCKIGQFHFVRTILLFLSMLPTFWGSPNQWNCHWKLFQVCSFNLGSIKLIILEHLN